MDGINQLWLIVLVHHQQCFLVHLAILGTYLQGQQHSIERGVSKRIFNIQMAEIIKASSQRHIAKS